ncbi:MAG: hypothetical protein RL095_2639 [Verrucomicrobiota bacterium]
MNHATSKLLTIPLQLSYQSGTHDLLRDFYLPALAASSLYQRAVGYFSSQSLALAAQGLESLLAQDGRLQILASPVLSQDDIDAIRQGYAERDILARALQRALDAPEVTRASRLCASPDPGGSGYPLSLLASLIAQNRLDVKIAIGDSGLFHLKIGLMTDARGDCIAFSGSANETQGGLVSNYEAIEVFSSWKDPARVAEKQQQFKSLWSGEAPGLRVYDFTALAAELLRPYLGAPHADAGLEVHEPAAPYRAQHEQAAEGCRAPRNSLWPHQLAAIAAWNAAGQVGLLEMCTGAGKTVTALEIVKRQLAEGNQSLPALAQCGRPPPTGEQAAGDCRAPRAA